MQGADEQLAEQAMRRVKAQASEEEAETLAFVLAVFIAQVHKSDELARAIVRRVCWRGYTGSSNVSSDTLEQVRERLGLEPQG